MNNKIFYVVTSVLSVAVIGLGVFAFLNKKEIAEKDLIIKTQTEDIVSKDTTIKEQSENISYQENTIKEQHEVISSLDIKVNELETQVAKLNCKGIWEDNQCKDLFLKLISPNGGESFCVGQTVPIKWESNKNIELVRFSASNGSGGASFNLGEEDASKGVYNWKVNLSPGTLYKVLIQGKNFNGTEPNYDTSDGRFEIKKCE